MTLFYFFCGWVIFCYIYIYRYTHTYLQYPFICGSTFRLLPCPISCISPAVNIGVHVSFHSFYIWRILCVCERENWFTYSVLIKWWFLKAIVLLYSTGTLEFKIYHRMTNHPSFPRIEEDHEKGNFQLQNQDKVVILVFNANVSLTPLYFRCRKE